MIEIRELRRAFGGVVALDGVSLKICDNAPDTAKARPTTFAAPAGSGHIFITFTREKS